MKKILAVVCLLIACLLSSVSHAACTQAFSTSAKGNFAAGLFLKTHTYKIAHYADAATWSAATAQYSTTNELATSGNYTAGGPALDSLTYGTSGTTYWIDFADETEATQTWSAASTCALIYDDTVDDSGCTASGTPYPCCTGSGTGTCANAVIGVFVYASAQPSAANVTVQFPTADATNAVIKFAFWEWLSTAMNEAR
jgi:hypothetical protein